MHCYKTGTVKQRIFSPSSFLLMLDPGCGMEQNLDPGSGINIPDPQNCCLFLLSFELDSTPLPPLNTPSTNTAIMTTSRSFSCICSRQSLHILARWVGAKLNATTSYNHDTVFFTFLLELSKLQSSGYSFCYLIKASFFVRRQC
jgi:hypothetical protein